MQIVVSVDITYASSTPTEISNQPRPHTTSRIAAVMPSTAGRGSGLRTGFGGGAVIRLAPSPVLIPSPSRSCPADPTA